MVVVCLTSSPENGAETARLDASMGAARCRLPCLAEQIGY